MPGRFLRLALVQERGGEEARLDRRLARIAALGGRLRFEPRRRARFCLGFLLVGIDGAAAHLLDELLQHAGGFLAARHAEIQPLLGLLHDLVGVGLAGVTALAAILLRHGGHHAPAQRPALGHLHALGHLDSRIVPRRFVVAVRHRIGEGGIGSGRQGRRARGLGRHEAREEAVQPVTLLGRERRALGNVGDEARLARPRRLLDGGHAVRAARSMPRGGTSARRGLIEWPDGVYTVSWPIPNCPPPSSATWATSPARWSPPVPSSACRAPTIPPSWPTSQSP